MNGIMNEALFYMLVACSAITAFNLLALESNELLSMEGATATYDLCLVLASMFVYCELSERLTITLNEIQNIFYESPWYQMPVKLQKSMTLPIQRAAVEFRLQSLGLVDCSLTTFLSVMSFVRFEFFFLYFEVLCLRILFFFATAPFPITLEPSKRWRPICSFFFNVPDNIFSIPSFHSVHRPDNPNSRLLFPDHATFSTSHLKAFLTKACL